MDVLLNCKQIDELSAPDKEEYFEKLRKDLVGNDSSIKQKSIIRNTASLVLPIVRNYDLSIQGSENIPKDKNCIFVINHSNTHDVPTMQEVFNKQGINQCFLAAYDEGLNPIIKKLFKECGAILFNRFDRSSANDALLNFTSNIVNGGCGVIFAESTWNLHPYKPMHLIKTGPVYSSVIADVPIVPVIFEYVETNRLCKQEKELYQECVVSFGKPIRNTYQAGLIHQTDILQKELEQLRKDSWNKYGIKKSNYNEEDIYRYLNHTFLKKFGGALQYDSTLEHKVLLVKDQLSSENDYHLDDNGLFVPGNLSKEEGKKYVSSKGFFSA